MRRCIPFLLSVLLIILILSAGCTSDSSSSSGSSPAANTGTGGVSADINVMDPVLASTYLQLSNLGFAFIGFNVTNPTDSPKTVIVESEIPGFTETSVNTIEVPAHGNLEIGQTPSLRNSVIPTEMTPATLHYKVTLADGTRIDEQSVPIKIYAKDTMIWQVCDEDNSECYDMSHYIAAWVTPHAAEIAPLVRAAANYHPDKSMSGYLCNDCTNQQQWEDYSDAQVKAIFTALKKDYQITYINSALAYGKSSNETPQRILLPRESLATKSANCIDGTVLYASALESVGINPHIILIPGHAFVCYDTMPDSSGRPSCLETTMTGSSTFEEAAAEGDEEYQAEITNGNFPSGISQDLSLAELRKEGLLPME